MSLSFWESMEESVFRSRKGLRPTGLVGEL